MSFLCLCKNDKNAEEDGPKDRPQVATNTIFDTGFHPYVLVVFRASILPGPSVKEQTIIYPKKEVNVADVILD